MRILMLNQYCSPEPNLRSVGFARALGGCGHDVRILTGFPNYPSGRIYPGYRMSLWRNEMIEGVPVLRVPLYPSYDRSGLRRMVTYLSFACCAAPPLLAGWRPDVIYVWSLPTLGWLAAVASVLRGIPYVIDIQDLWPDAAFNSGMISSWMGGGLRRLCSVAYGRAAGVAVLAPGLKRTLADRGISPGRIEVIYNWCDEPAMSAALAEPSGLDDPGFDLGFEGRFNILFAGMMNRAQGLDAVINAARLAGEQNPRIQFVFLGSGRQADELRALAERVAPAFTRFLPRVPPAAAAHVQRRADVLLVHLRKSPLYSVTIPSKTGAAFFLGRPILMGVEGDARNLVESAGAGLGCEPENPQSIAAAALRLASMPADELATMGQRGRSFYDRELSMKVGVDRFDAFLRRTVASDPRRA